MHYTVRRVSALHALFFRPLSSRSSLANYPALAVLGRKTEFMTLYFSWGAGASLLVWRRSESQSKIEPTGSGPGTPSQAAKALRSGK